MYLINRVLIGKLFEVYGTSMSLCALSGGTDMFCYLEAINFCKTLLGNRICVFVIKV